MDFIKSLTLFYNPNFLLLESDIKEEFIFYNSSRHYGCRLKKVELLLLEQLYKYDDIGYICLQFPTERRRMIEETLRRIKDEHILSIVEKQEVKQGKVTKTFPETFYLHLTYKCNLSCSYCYNKQIRSDFRTLPLADWKKIADRIAPYASHIVLTGGECFLYPDIIPFLKYLKETMKKTRISVISNCMHDFSGKEFNGVFDYIDHVTFSCDSISREGERKGFRPELFKKNVAYIKKIAPQVDVSITVTNTRLNQQDMAEVRQYCQQAHCNCESMLMIPSCIEEISMMQPLFSYRKEQEGNIVAEEKWKHSPLLPKRIRCGAAKGVCSVDPKGNVYPCQTMHYDDFLMGNLLLQELKDLRYQDDEECMPNVDEIADCQHCKVRYICGGGCLSSGYVMEKGKLYRNRLVCPYNYQLSILKLKSLQNVPKQP